MRRTALLRALATMAREADLRLVLVREGGEHSIYRIGDVQFAVPRHREINELTAKGILKVAAGAARTGGETDA